MAARKTKSPSGRIDDMLDAMPGIRAADAGDSEDVVASDWVRRRAIERGFEIIREASRHIPPELQRDEPGIA
jgi:uncharacterized protein with HEPN domain